MHIKVAFLSDILKLDLACNHRKDVEIVLVPGLPAHKMLEQLNDPGLDDQLLVSYGQFRTIQNAVREDQNAPGYPFR